MLKAALIRMFYTGTLFLASLVLSNLALPEKFGSLSLLILNASLLIIITGLGIDSMVLYKLSNKQWSVSQAFHFIWKGIFFQVVIFGFLELGAWLIFHRTLLCSAGPDYFIIETFYFIGLAIVEKYVSLFYAQNQSVRVNRILAIVALFYLALLLFFYFIKVKWIYVLYLFAFQNVVQALALVMIFKPQEDKRTYLQNQEVLAHLKISSVVMITNVIQLMAYRVDFWLLDYYYNNYEVGIYAQANKFANFAWIVPNIISQILIPKFASIKNTQTRDVFSSAFRTNVLLILLTAAFAHFFYFFYLDPKYREGITAFYLMLPGYFFSANVIYFANYFSSKGKFGYNLKGSVLCFIIIFVADIILIPAYGINGAGLANTLAYFSVFMVYLVFMKKSSFFWKDLILPRQNSFFNVYKLINK